MQTRTIAALIFAPVVLTTALLLRPTAEEEAFEKQSRVGLAITEFVKANALCNEHGGRAYEIKVIKHWFKANDNVAICMGGTAPMIPMEN